MISRDPSDLNIQEFHALKVACVSGMWSHKPLHWRADGKCNWPSEKGHGEWGLGDPRGGSERGPEAK